MMMELAESPPLGARVALRDRVVAVALDADDAVSLMRDDDPAVGRAEAAEAPCLRRLRSRDSALACESCVNLPFGRRARYAPGVVTGERKPPEPLPATLAGLVDLRAGAPGDAVVFPGERAGYREFADASIDMARRLHARGRPQGRPRRAAAAGLAGCLRAAARGDAARRDPGSDQRPLQGRGSCAYVIGHSGMKILITDPAYAELLEEAGAPRRAGSWSARDDAEFAAGADAVDAATVAAAQSERRRRTTTG